MLKEGGGGGRVEGCGVVDVKWKRDIHTQTHFKILDYSNIGNLSSGCEGTGRYAQDGGIREVTELGRCPR